jgi:hypothetical protein
VAGFRREQFRCDHQRIERGVDLRVLAGVERQDAALFDQSARQRFGEQPLRQPHVERLALALIAGLVLGRERQRHIGAGVGVFAEILHRLADAVAGARIRQHQRKLRRPRTAGRGAARSASLPLPSLFDSLFDSLAASGLRAANCARASVTP